MSTVRNPMHRQHGINLAASRVQLIEYAGSYSLQYKQYCSIPHSLSTEYWRVSQPISERLSILFGDAYGQSKSEGFCTLFARKPCWGILEVSSPKLLSLFAIMQWNAANISVAEMRKIGEYDWTIVRAFYANAGGFILETKDCPAAENCHLTTRTLYDCLHITHYGNSIFLDQQATNGLRAYYYQSDWLIAGVLIAAGEAAKKTHVDTPMDFVERETHPVKLEAPPFTSALLWSPFAPLIRIPKDYCPPPPTGKEAFCIWIVSVVHAGVHLIGWAFEFPIYAEACIWRVSSTTLLLVMVFGGAVLSCRVNAAVVRIQLNLLCILVIDAEKSTWIGETG
ncbi:hypothetical protein LARI1_G003070 [Lachnellula arida]|uniref:Uncharacterized protein n=1 Tax=Lachnellula arida TaxID=1316785 RepID=A0A8T9BKI1_9HELO|nr:hypothetical protein LARI1_G003070 [Lachnellula arida]